MNTLTAVRKELSRNVANGTVIRFNGWWGVKEGRTIDRWYEPRIRLYPNDVVEVPAKRRRS